MVDWFGYLVKEPFYAVRSCGALRVDVLLRSLTMMPLTGYDCGEPSETLMLIKVGLFKNRSQEKH